jgi:hypothetical protein
MVDYKIAIPSYNRIQQVEHRTLNFLFRHNIDHSKIYIFVHPLSYDEYVEVLKTKYPNINIVESKCGIKNSRNYINQYFNEGDKIVEIDDDIQDLINLREDKPLENLNEFIEESFSMCGNGMFGVSALTNKFFATMHDKFGLRSIVATFHGYTLDKSIKLTLDLMEDFQKVILYYLKEKPILKRGWIGIRTKYWTLSGGLQTEYDREKRLQLQNFCAQEIANTYPHLVYQRTRKNKLIDIRFKRNIK